MQIRKNRGLFFGVFIAYGIGILLADMALPLWYRHIIDLVSSTTDRISIWPSLLHYLLFVAITMVAYNIFFRIGDYALSLFQARTMKNLADYAFTTLTKHSYQFFANSFSGGLVTKVKRFVRSFMDAHDNIVYTFWFTSIQVLGAITVLCFVALPLAIILGTWTIIYVWFAWVMTKKKMPFDLKESTTDSKVTGRLADVITNILNLKIFSSRSREIKGFETVTEVERTARYRAWRYGNMIYGLQAIFFSVLEFSIILASLYLWREGIISVGIIVMMQFYLFAMFHNLWNLGKSMGRVSKHFADASELVEIFETPIDILDPVTPEKLVITSGNLKIDKITFYYGDQDNPVFKNFTLELPAGQTVGLVGHSGAGKSTITKLLLRFADIQKGAITIDGQDIRNITQDDLRSKIAYVPQEPILFHRSLRENIAYGNPNATEKEIIEASKKAHAHEFIINLSKGYETLVGERGIKLSGGERQRVAIARAMLKDAPILILDEATSSLDSVSEGYIQEAFKELMRGRTTIVIAHRLSTVQKLDRLVVIADGKIVEDGTHAELIAKKGVYANFWEHQTSGFIE